MTNTVLITRKLIDPFQLTQLRRDGHNVRILHIFEPNPTTEHLALLDDLPWVEKILLEDDIYTQFSPLFARPTERMGNYVYTNTALSDYAQHFHSAPGTVLFVPCNDTHVKMMLPMAAKLANHRFLVIRGENAEPYLEDHGEAFDRMSLKTFQSAQFIKPMTTMLQEGEISAVVFGNDWTGENWRICQLSKLLGIPSICVQEGPQDYELEGGKHMQMKYAEHILLQGLRTLPYLNARNFAVTGNPRLTCYTPLPLPNSPVVLINSNFTYGVFEEARDQWVADCVGSCNDAGIEYFISQHPRDHGDLKAYNVIKSDAFKLPEQLGRCNVVITRFSQVVHEAMLSNRQVIYYNPHGEVKRVQTEDHTGGYFHASNRQELTAALRIAVQTEFPNLEQRRRCNLMHCGPCDGAEIDRAVWAICQIANQQYRAPARLTKRPPAVREFLRKVRRRLARWTQ